MWGNQGGFSGYGQDGGGGGGGGGGGAGGGFMSSPGFNSSQGAGGGDKGGKRSRATNLIPCSVADIVSAENADGAYRVAGGRVEAGQVCVIGLVKAVRESQIRVEYEIDDSTGPVLDVRQFTEQAEDAVSETRSKPFPENTFIRVYGHIRDNNNKRMLAAFKVEPVEDMNILTSHLLEIVYSRLYFAKGQDENMNMETGDVKREIGGGTFQQGGDSSFYNGFTKAQTDIHRMISGDTSEHGASIQQLTANCRGLSEKQIRDAIDFLSGEGHIYSTIDDDHFRTTDS